MSDLPPNATRLLLARHGQSTWNADGRWQGQADPPLSDFGVEQALSAASRVGAVDLIASSPQERALRTAAIIGRQIGVEPIIVVDDLRERSAGPWSGMTRSEIDAEYPGYLEEGKRPNGYELDEPLVARVNAALTNLVREYRGSTILVVCHGGVIKAMEEAHGVVDGRIPNLSGRIFDHVPSPGDQGDPQDEEGRWRVGERLALLDPEQSTGGDPHRI